MIRVFPRRTAATPDDSEVRIGPPGLFDRGEGQQVDISCTFIWDRPECECLAEAWQKAGYSPRIGGPAYDDPGSGFVPGKYLKKGYVITSRGCNNHCWFCKVPRREGVLREIAITEGYNVLDNNLLACSEHHRVMVFDMLRRQKKRPIFTGGLESRLLTPAIAKELYELRTERMYFAYDTPDDWEPLENASKIIREAGFREKEHKVFVYVLIGFKGDTFEAAEYRLKATMILGMIPFAMLYQDGKHRGDIEWRRFQKVWCRPRLIFKREPGLRGVKKKGERTCDDEY